MLDLIPGLQSTSSALSAERLRLDLVAQNIANANTSRGLDGRPYQRQLPVFETVLHDAQSNPSTSANSSHSIRVARIQLDQRPPRLVHNPSHPDAGSDGMVALPNINIHEEMVDLIAASRAYEANLAVVKTARGMALQTLSIGKR